MAQWIHALRTFNPEPGVPLGLVAKWLVITRACAFSPHPILSGLVSVRDAIPRDLREKYDLPRGDQSFPLWPLWYVVWGVI